MLKFKNNISPINILIMFILGLNFLAYPFFFRNLNTALYLIMANSSFVILLVSLYTKNRAMIYWKYSYQPKEIKLFVIFYVLYFLVLILTSLMHSGEVVVAKGIVTEIRDLMFIVILLLFLSNEALILTLQIYMKVLALCSALGLLLLLGIHIGAFSPISEMNIGNYSEGADAVREVYLFGFVWPHSWLGSLYGLERLQSYCDEAGTFAMALTPAMILAFVWKRYVLLLTMIVALFFTFSVGAILAWTVALFIYLYSQMTFRITIKHLSLFLFIFIGIFLIAQMYVQYDSDITQYMTSKISSDIASDETSLGQRMNGLLLIFEAIMNNPEGFGVKSRW